MAKFVILFVCAIVIQTSLALVCYKCNGKADDCSKSTEETCPKPPEGQMAACLNYVYENANKEKYYERKCVSQTKDKPYGCVPNPGTTEIECKTCTEDKCNSATSINASLFAIISALILYKLV